MQKIKYFYRIFKKKSTIDLSFLIREHDRAVKYFYYSFPIVKKRNGSFVSKAILHRPRTFTIIKISMKRKNR
jgi:hypothetical protein